MSYNNNSGTGVTYISVGTTAERENIVGIRINSDTNLFEYYAGGLWTPVSGGGSGTVTISATQVAYGTGVNAVGGNANFTYDSVNNALLLGTLPFPNTKIHADGSVNSYLQINLQNESNGTSASGDIIVTADTGTDTTNYGDFGINSSTYSEPLFSIYNPLSTYLYSEGGDLVIGTRTAEKNLIFHAAGTTTAERAMVVSGVTGQKGYVGFLEGTSSNPTLLGKIHIVNENDTVGTFFADRYSTANSAFLTLRRARGTVSSPTAVQLNDSLGGLGFRGYGDTSFSANTRANIIARANGNWTDVAQGANLEFNVTTVGTTTSVNILTLTSTSLTTAATTIAVFDTTATTVTAFGAATALTIGNSAGTLTIRSSPIVGANATQTLFNTVATTINFGGAATAWTVGATTGTFTLRNPTVVGSQTTATLWNTVATTVSFAGAATTLTIGGTPTGSVTHNYSTNATANANTKTINIGTAGVSGSITNINIGSAVSGATGTLTLGSTTIVGSNATQIFFNTVTTTITAFGAATTSTLFGTTATQTLNIATGATLNGSTKTINIAGNGVSGSTTTINLGPSAASGSTTNINIGSEVSGATNNIKLNLVPASDATGDIFYRNSSGFITRLAIGASGTVLTVSAGLPVWASATSVQYLQFSMLGEASSTLGLFTKASDIAAPTGNPSGAPTTSSGNPGINNGTVDPYLVPAAGTITEIRIKFAGAGVSTGTVGTPTVRLRIYRVDYSTRTQLGTDIDITISATGVGTFNNSSGDAFQTAVSSALSIAVSAGDLIGLEFINQSGTNDGINSIRRLFATVKIA